MCYLSVMLVKTSCLCNYWVIYISHSTDHLYPKLCFVIILLRDAASAKPGQESICLYELIELRMPSNQTHTHTQTNSYPTYKQNCKDVASGWKMTKLCCLECHLTFKTPFAEIITCMLWENSLLFFYVHPLLIMRLRGSKGFSFLYIWFLYCN